MNLESHSTNIKTSNQTEQALPVNSTTCAVFTVTQKACECLTLFTFHWGWFPANIRINFTSPETRRIVLPDLKTARSYVHFSGQNTGIWRTDRWTDMQISSSYYSGQHCKQCGRAVKNHMKLIFLYTLYKRAWNEKAIPKRCSHSIACCEVHITNLSQVRIW